MGSRGICAAGHPLTAETGAGVLREGGNAVDAAIAAMLVSWVAEPLLTGPGAGGYLLVAGAGTEPALLDFFVAAPSGDRGAGAELLAVDVSFGDAVQVFHVGAASCGAYGTPAGIEAAARRWGSEPLDRLAAPAVRHAREGVAVNRQQAYIFEILEGILLSDDTARAEFAPQGRPLREGELFRSPDLAATIERLGAEGAAPFYSGDIAAAIVDFLALRGGLLTTRDLADYEAIEREPVRTAYRGRDVVTNPPPSAGGTLIALALALLDRADGPPSPEAIVAVMEAVQAERTPAFLEGLAAEPGFAERLIASRLGSTTHISVVDAAGLACSVTCTNGEGCGLVVPGTGIQVNNIMGEEDLSPLGFHTAPAGRRMPSMMAPTAVLRGGELDFVLGSAGSNRIRSAILQTIVGVVDLGLTIEEAVERPRCHFEAGTTYVEPGVSVQGRDVVAFRDRNLFFGGVQAVQRDPAGGTLRGAGDPRRGGAVAVA